MKSLERGTVVDKPINNMYRNVSMVNREKCIKNRAIYGITFCGLNQKFTSVLFFQVMLKTFCHVYSFTTAKNISILRIRVGLPLYFHFYIHREKAFCCCHSKNVMCATFEGSSESGVCLRIWREIETSSMDTG